MLNLKGKVKEYFSNKELLINKAKEVNFVGDLRKNKILIENEFDEKYYLKQNPDVLNFEISAIDHYIRFGAKEGRNPNCYFETNFYITECGDSRVINGELNPFAHYITYGREQLLNPRPIKFPLKDLTPDSFEHILNIIVKEFDPSYYLENNPDVRRAGVDPIKHFIVEGWKESRNPNSTFIINAYLLANIDVKEAGINPFYHYIAQGKSEGRMLSLGKEDKHSKLSSVNSHSESYIDYNPNLQEEIYSNSDDQYNHIYEVLDKEFDREYYLNANPDVAEANLDPLYHFIVQGWSEGRNPAENFNTKGYLSANKDVLEAGVNPFYHYVVAGRAEGRSLQEVAAKAPKNEEVKFIIETIKQQFNSAFYLKMYPEVKALGVDPVEHYVLEGWNKGFWPTPDFNSTYYLSDNPDVKEAGVNPFYHYLVSGKNERRYSDQPGGDVANTILTIRTADEIANTWVVNTSVELMTKEAIETLFSVSLHEVNYLSFSHDVYLKNLGGVQQCVAIEQQEANKQGFGYLHLAPVQPLPFMAEKRNEFLFHLSINGIYEGVVNWELLELCLKKINAEFRPIIHVLHGHSAEIIEKLLIAVNRPHTIFWLHDYLSICEGYNLLRNNVVFCGAPSQTSQACSICIHGSRREKHYKRVEKLFNSIDMNVVAPSEFTLDLWRSKSSLKMKSNRVIEHLSLELDSIRPDHVGGVIRIGFLGFPAYLKGWGDFAKLVKKFICDERYEFVHLAHENPNLLPIEFVEAKATFDDREAMIRAVRKSNLDLVFIPAKSPETFGFTAYEAVAGGAKVITYSDAGNVSAFVAQYNSGAIFNDFNEVNKLLEAGITESLLSGRSYSKPIYSKMSMDLS
ncbi:hypothetical protein ACJJH9_03115 [Microbulbifer sp. DLAB2-AF]|uniref:hypothetical protein n=1 Tax=Microbulbifer sp. DLAB2-AF TaxID=3243395 RepID=UPI00403A6A14